MDLASFLNQNSLIISAALFIIGLFLKQTPKVKNWIIPYILSIISIIFCNVTMGFSFDSTIQAIIAAGLAVYVHQLGKEGKVCLAGSDDSPKNK